MKELTCAAEWQAAAETACVPVYWGSSPRCLKNSENKSEIMIFSIIYM